MPPPLFVGPVGLDSPTEPPVHCAVLRSTELSDGLNGPDCSAGAHDEFFYFRAHAGDMITCACGKVEGR